MNITTQLLVKHLMLPGLSVLLFSGIHPKSVKAQEGQKKPAAIVWINSFYGPNNSGLGLAARYGILGIGATFFNFAGDTTWNMPPRPGGVAVSVDIYGAADLSDWFALYGNIGYVGRLTTYRDQRDLLRDSPQRDFMSLGGGVQLSLASHLVFGTGYNLAIDTPDKQGDATDQPIQSIVAQVGYRF